MRRSRHSFPRPARSPPGVRRSPGGRQELRLVVTPRVDGPVPEEARGRELIGPFLDKDTPGWSQSEPEFGHREHHPPNGEPHAGNLMVRASGRSRPYFIDCAAIAQALWANAVPQKRYHAEYDN